MVELTEMVYKRLCRSCRLMISDIDGSCSRCGTAFGDSAALSLAPHPVATPWHPAERVPSAARAPSGQSVSAPTGPPG
jgi:hypothetical protein